MKRAVKRYNSLISAIAVLVILTLSIFTGVHPEVNAADGKSVFSSVVLNVGADETKRNLTWYTQSNQIGLVQFAAISTNVDKFPSKYVEVTAKTTASKNKAGYYINKVTLENLEENTNYIYRLVCGDEISNNYYFRVGSFGDYSFAFLGDPQFNTEKYSAEWKDTLQKVDKEFDAEFIVSAGDQINNPDAENEYDLFIVDELSSFAFAPTIGTSHDTKSQNGKGIAYKEHYNLPNESNKYGVTKAGGDYWYTYNNTLFMNLNIEANSANDFNNHKEFMKQAISANSNAVWKVVVVHASIFATGMHSSKDYKYYDSEIAYYREMLAPMFSELDIDIVLSGHDHVYVRSWLMDGTKASDDEIIDDYVVNPSGVQYISANSSTGSKFYDCSVYDTNYVAFENYFKRKSAIIFNVTDTKFTMNAYFLNDMSRFDTFTIYNTQSAVPHKHKTVAVEAKTPTHQSNGNIKYYCCTDCNLFFADEQAKVEINIKDTVVNKTEHSFGKEYLKDESKHWLQCECGAINSEGAHKFELNDQTPESNDDKEKYCSVCGYKSDDMVSILEKEEIEENTEKDVLEQSDNDNTDENISFSTIYIIVICVCTVIVSSAIILTVIILKKKKIKENSQSEE